MSERIKSNSIQKLLLEEKDVLHSQLVAINTEKQRYNVGHFGKKYAFENVFLWGEGVHSIIFRSLCMYLYMYVYAFFSNQSKRYIYQGNSYFDCISACQVG